MTTAAEPTTTVEITIEGWQEVARNRQLEVERLKSWIRVIGRMRTEGTIEVCCKHALAGEPVCDPRYTL